jgi:hypothetical protein
MADTKDKPGGVFSSFDGELELDLPPPKAPAAQTGRGAPIDLPPVAPQRSDPIDLPPAKPIEHSGEVGLREAEASGASSEPLVEHGSPTGGGFAAVGWQQGSAASASGPGAGELELEDPETTSQLSTREVGGTAFSRQAGSAATGEGSLELDEPRPLNGAERATTAYGHRQRTPSQLVEPMYDPDKPSRTGRIVLLVILALAGFGGWYGYSHYKASDKAHGFYQRARDLRQDLLKVDKRINEKHIEQIARRLAAEHDLEVVSITATIDPITSANMMKLDKTVRMGLGMAAKITGGKSNRICIVGFTGRFRAKSGLVTKTYDYVRYTYFDYVADPGCPEGGRQKNAGGHHDHGGGYTGGGHAPSPSNTGPGGYRGKMLKKQLEDDLRRKYQRR